MKEEQAKQAEALLKKDLTLPKGSLRPEAMTEYTGEFDSAGLHYYVFRYRRYSTAKWKLAVCGGYPEDGEQSGDGEQSDGGEPKDIRVFREPDKSDPEDMARSTAAAGEFLRRAVRKINLKKK